MFNLTEFQNSIKLLVPEKLEKSEARLWYKSVKQFAPAGTLNPIVVMKDDGSNGHVSMRVAKVDTGWVYDVPLNRRLTEQEAEVIVVEFAEDFDGDFDIETTASATILDCTIPDVQHKLEEDMVARSIQEHNEWMTSKIIDGWRFGVIYNEEQKTHPLMRPWEQLPESLRIHSPELEQAILDQITN